LNICGRIILESLKPLVRVIDDDDAMRRSWAFLIEGEGWDVVTYSDALDFIASNDFQRPGCLVLDVRMPRMSGLELQDKMQELGIDLPIIFISGHGDIDMAVDTMQRGAVAFVQKTADPSRLMEAVYKAVAQTQANKPDPGEAVARWNTLTPKEKDVAKLLAKGLLNREVGIRLGGISVKTVQVHRSEINRKLGVKGVVELTEAVNRIRALLGEAAA